MVMGPDCGTAIVNGVPLGFANVVRRGPIGVVGASGTGTQEVTVRIHQLGSGVSQALGTGGHDLSELIGGISMLHGLAALDADPATSVIVLVSKPPAPEVAAKGAGGGRGQRQTRGRDFPRGRSRLDHPQRRPWRGLPRPGRRHGCRPCQGWCKQSRCRSRSQAKCSARLAVLPAPWRRGSAMCAASSRAAPSASKRSSSMPRRASSAFSNMPDGRQRLAAKQAAKARRTPSSTWATTNSRQGRPHPMIDPSLRDARIRDEVDDPTTAVVLFDVVLGYGSAADPIAGLLGVIGSSQGQGKSRRPHGRVHRLRLRDRPGPAGSQQDRGRPQSRRRAGSLVQCRSRHLVGRHYFRTPEEHSHEDAISSKTSRSSTSACKALRPTSRPPAATSLI